MEEDHEDSLEGNDGSVSLESHEDGEEENLEDEEETEAVDSPSSSTEALQKRSRRKKASQQRRNNTSQVRDTALVNLPDPYSVSSDEVCEAVGLLNVPVDYDEPMFEGITNLKNFSYAVRPLLYLKNPGAPAIKMYPVIQSKYKEFQNHMIEKGTPIQKGLRYHHGVIASESTCLDQSGPLLSNTRKSGRKRNNESRYGPESDQEFETMIKNHEKESQRLEEEKDNSRNARAASRADKRRSAFTLARAARKARRERGDPDLVQNENCEACDQIGDLVLCDTCPRVYHTVCIDPDMEDPPEGDWSCPHCMKHGPEDDDSTPVRLNETFCKICKETDHILPCANCLSSYHAYCINPPLEEMPADDWQCPRCTTPDPKRRIDKILHWKWVRLPYPAPIVLKDGEPENADDMFLKPPRAIEPRQEREFFVKWNNLSYWRCEWLSETMMEVHFPALLRSYWRKYSSQKPPTCDEWTIHCHQHKQNDPLNLRERYFQFGVKPEWMQVHKIINHTSYSRHQQDYYVKWNGLGYDQCTWERDDDVDSHIPDLGNAIAKYWLHREAMLNERIPRPVFQLISGYRESLKKPPRDSDSSKNPGEEEIDIRQKYETQPDYITETGGNLHPYQLEGINWLRHSWANGTDAILADEMGLGKTVQSLSFLYSLMKEGYSQGPFLVAAPLSTIINWEREAEQWCPDFYVVSYVGDQQSRLVIRQNEFSFYNDAVKGAKVSKIRNQGHIKFHVLLASYETINMDKALLSSIDWEVLVVDEAHRLKNNQSSFFKNLCEYKINYRLLLTGTPLQNNLEELFHLLNFLSPESFNELDKFTSTFSEISKEDQIEKLHSLLGPHMLRRLKADVLTGMPTKSELIVRVELSQLQKKYYKNILTRNFEALNVKNGGTHTSLLNILMELKKCCNHPYLFPRASLEAPTLPNGEYEPTALIKNAGKFALLQKMMRKLQAGGHRVLIFSQMTMMLDILEIFCDAENYKFERIDGSITGQQRQNAIDRFNAPESKAFVFLLSTRAGGLGINLATADTVIIYDSDWNPHNDIQAFSRAHRLGQKHKVMIYRFVTKNSVEERITSVAKKKMLLTHLVVRAGLGGKDGKNMSKTELDDVLRWGTEELFKDEEASTENPDGEGTSEGSKKATEQEIVWDDAAVDFLLDRDKEEEVADGDKKEHWTNEYLSSFKVATYTTKEAGELVEDEKNVVEEIDTNNADPSYWEKLLKRSFQEGQEAEQELFGKGKRQRRPVNYTDKMAQNIQIKKMQQEDDDDNDSVSVNSDTVDLVHSDDDFEETTRRSRRVNADVLPPLISHMGNNIEVLGFTLRQRRAFTTAVLRWGMPPEDHIKVTVWQGRDLKLKPDKVLRAYGALFMRHLCEPESQFTDKFSDGIPKDYFPRTLLLTRIGLNALILRKVQEFEQYNGEWSMPETCEEVMAEIAELFEQEDALLAEVKQEPPDEDVENINVTDTPTTSNCTNPVNAPRRSTRPPSFKFNICDGGFTDLHHRWTLEEKESLNGKHYKFWNRRHDYWLLSAIALYGFGRFNPHFQDAYNDPKYSILNEPFKWQSEESKKLTGCAQQKFIQKRYKLLESSLVIEEQLRRAAHLNKHITPDNIGELTQNFKNLEDAAESGVDMANASREGDRNANAVLHNILNTLSDALDKMKTDVQRVPTIVNRLGSVTDRLQMSERKIFARLAGGKNYTGPTVAPNGPFVYPSTHQRLPTIQPRFRSLYPNEEIEPTSTPISTADTSNIQNMNGSHAEPIHFYNHNIPSTSDAHLPSSSHHSEH